MKTRNLNLGGTAVPVASLVGLTTQAQAGGTINFGNNSSNRVVNGHTAAAITADANVQAALYWSPLASNNFVQLGAIVTVGVPVAGIFVGGTHTTGDNTPGGASAKFLVRAWAGGYATYEEAVLQSGVLIGQSAVFVNPTGNPSGAPPAPPESLLAGGFTGFAISSNVIGTQPPIISGLGNKTVACEAAWSFDSPTATDGCTGTNLTAVVLATITNGTCPMTVTRTWSVTNSCGTNFATYSQAVTVVDITPPALDCANSKVVKCGAPWDFDLPAVNDGCSGTNLALAIVSTITNEFCPLVVTRNWSATDICGNSNQCAQTVTVTPAGPPALACVANKVVSCTNEWSFNKPAALDNCGGTNVSVELVGTMTNSLCPLSLTRSWRATNDCNLEGVSCSQTVTVLCPSCPVLELTIACPPSPVPPGGTLLWTGTITNASDIVISNVVVLNDQPAANTIVLGPVTLGPGEGSSFGGGYAVTNCCGPYIGTLTASGTGLDEILFTGSATASCAGTNHITPGDMNGDGIVDQGELNAVLANYWANSPWIYMTNAALQSDGRFQFELTNASAWNFTVLVSTNATDWTNLPTPAFPVYQFVDPEGTNAPRRLYRLQWP